MDVTKVYATALGGTAALLFAYPRAFFYLYRHAKLLCRKHLLYSYAHKHSRTTRFDVILGLLFLGTNAFCLAFNTRNIHDFMKRSGAISVVNLIPLSLGGQMNPILDFCGIDLNNCLKVHQWIGWIAILEGLMHVVAAVSVRKPDLRTRSDVAALSAAILYILILCSAPIRRHIYELFIKLHFLFATTIVAAVFVHERTAIAYLLAAICLNVSVRIVAGCYTLYRSARDSKGPSRIQVERPAFRGEHVDDAVHVHVRLSRPWKPQAGQYVYLSIPELSRTAFAQAHPLYVSWWYQHEVRDGETVAVETRIVFIVSKQAGFSKRLLQFATDGPRRITSASKGPDSVRLESGGPDTKAGSFHDKHFGIQEGVAMKAILEGPYGKRLDMQPYNTVLLFASGIGIAGLLPYIKQFLEDQHNSQAKAKRRIALFWEVESESQIIWVANLMDELLRMDDEFRMLDIKLFVLRAVVSHASQRIDTIYHKIDTEAISKEKKPRIDMIYREMDVETQIGSELRDHHGRALITSSAKAETSDRIRRVVRSKLDENIHLEELDFRPGSCRKRHRLAALLGKGTSSV